MGVPSAAIYKSRMPGGVTSDTMWWMVCLYNGIYGGGGGDSNFKTNGK